MAANQSLSSEQMEKLRKAVEGILGPEYGYVVLAAKYNQQAFGYIKNINNEQACMSCLSFVESIVQGKIIKPLNEN